jgi:molybdopterin-containing oxidoreductase family membrane subunit
MAWFGPSKLERDVFWFRAFGHYAWAFWIMFTCNVIIPLSLWVKPVRRHMGALFGIAVCVNIGMWFERFNIIVLSLARPIEPAAQTWYRISWTEIAVTAGAFAWFFMFFLVFVRVLPAFSVVEIKETLPFPYRRKHA